VDATTEKLVRRLDRLAMQAPRKAIRAHLLSIARLHDVDVQLTERTRQNIAESKELIAKATTILCGH
jgi:hypothetical protein